MKKSVNDDDQQAVMSRLAVTLQLLRQKEGLSLREFAKKLEVDPSGLSRLENGTNLNPSLFLIRKLAKGLDLTVDELMNFEAKTCPTCGGKGWVK
jgi:transcriptional regulator with XRE-family HTH domain